MLEIPNSFYIALFADPVSEVIAMTCKSMSVACFRDFSTTSFSANPGTEFLVY